MEGRVEVEVEVEEEVLAVVVAMVVVVMEVKSIADEVLVNHSTRLCPSGSVTSLPRLPVSK